jgi:aminoglycoside phosphotransferase (APT) family kinase protein
VWTKLNPESSHTASAHSRDDVERVINSFLSVAEPGSSCSYLSGGASNLTFIKRRGNDESVLRFFGRGAPARDESLAEADILRACFPENCLVESFETSDHELALLEMTVLAQPRPSPSEVWELQVHFQSAISHSGLESLFSLERDISALGARASLALDIFASDGQLSASEVAHSSSLLANLADFLVEAPRVPCHGDLSPGNVLLNSAVSGNQSGLVAIDWEDRFWGVRDYDFLYWLTFMTNARHLRSESLRIARQPHETSVALVLMIVTLKELIAVSAGVARDGRKPPADRIRAVLELL